MHEYRRFIQQQLDERRWKQADLVRASGLTRQHIWSILSDKRKHLGQMPDESTLEALSNGFGLPTEVFRTAAARSLVGYVDDGVAPTIQLRDVSTDALLNEVRRRIDANQSSNAHSAAPSGASSEASKAQEAGQPLSRSDLDLAARDVGTKSVGRQLREKQDFDAEHSQDEVGGNNE